MFEHTAGRPQDRPRSSWNNGERVCCADLHRKSALLFVADLAAITLSCSGSIWMENRSRSRLRPRDVFQNQYQVELKTRSMRLCSIGFGAAPTILSTSRPPLKKINVGMP